MSPEQSLPRVAPRTRADSRERVFVVASDGRPDSDPAFQLANLLAGNSGSVRAVAVVEQVDLIPEGQAVFSAEVEAMRRRELHDRVVAQTQRTIGRTGELEIREGDCAKVIAHAASRSKAAMILAGIGRHDVPARLFGNETVLRVMRLSEVPVLAVARHMKHLPRRIIAAIDFSEPSIRALRLAVGIAAPGATISLAYVAPRDSMLYDWDKSYMRNVLKALNALKEQLELPVGVVFTPVLLQGDPATELLAHAKSIDADLITAGSHGRGFLARSIVGSVITRIVRASTCSVLAVPRTASRPSLESSTMKRSALVPAHWPALLDDISSQNVGRMTTLEEDGNDLGAQTEETMLRFMGATYDPYDGHVQLMFEGSNATRSHLSRNIADVSLVEVLQDDLGQDIALHIAHGGGQTRLSFRPNSFDF